MQLKPDLFIGAPALRAAFQFNDWLGLSASRSKGAHRGGTTSKITSAGTPHLASGAGTTETRSLLQSWNRQMSESNSDQLRGRGISLLARVNYESRGVRDSSCFWNRADLIKEMAEHFDDCELKLRLAQENVQKQFV